MATWQCVKNCGACCQLSPSDRPELADYLSADDLAGYLSMVGADGWCIHYDQITRECTIYETRPSFCRVTAETFQAMFDIEPEALDEFAIDCCQQQIAGVYGDDSLEMSRFNQAIAEPQIDS
ncbi:MAG: YkgJ family cysteine cluster protein [Leptolyngbya sp. SIO4C1]|nr:YkgJ family cysteine cluster protein [Leptolyngbya sp. SIO4C1]